MKVDFANCISNYVTFILLQYLLCSYLSVNILIIFENYDFFQLVQSYYQIFCIPFISRLLSMLRKSLKHSTILNIKINYKCCT